MGLAALNPMPGFRARIRSLVAAEFAVMAAVGIANALSATTRALRDSMRADALDAEGRLHDAIRESEARTRADIAELRARHVVIPIVETSPNSERGALSGDPCRPREVKDGPELVDPAGRAIGGKRHHP